MPRRIVANSFVSGEISPELYGRHDLKAYFNGAASLSNFLVRRTGGIRKRPGTEVLFTLDASQQGDDAGAKDNKFKVFPYLFDTDSFGLLIFRLDEDNSDTLQSRFVKVTADATTSTEWTDVPVSTGITATSELDDLRFKQVGDTLFFTRRGHQAFRCVITYAESTTEFYMIENFLQVATPNAITATPANFDFDVHEEMTKHYALYGVKDGVLSKPALTTATASTPWTQGATITVTGTLDFNAHDYYILAKKSGMNYGKLSEIYPVEVTDEVPLTLVSSDATHRGTTVGFPASGNGFFTTNPERVATWWASRNMVARSMALLTTEVAGWNQAVTPHYLVDFGTSSAKTAWFMVKGDVIDTETMRVKTIDYTGKDFKITPFYYPDDGSEAITLGSTVTPTADANGMLQVSLGAQDGVKRVGFFFECEDINLSDDAIVISGMTITDASLTVCQASDADLTVPEALEADPSAATCQPTVFAKVANWSGSTTLYYTTLWNLREPLEVYCNDIDDWGTAHNRDTESRAIPTDSDFTTTVTELSEVTFTVPEAQSNLASVHLFVGGLTVNWADGSKATESKRQVAVTLYAIDGAVESKVQTWNVAAGYRATQILTVDFPDDVPPTTKYKLLFHDVNDESTANAIWTRGIRCYYLNTSLNFVDDNIVPSEITGQQDMLTVGDSNMDCGLFDIYEQRSVFVSSNDLPFSMWFSAAGDLYNFYANRPQADDDAFTVTIPAKRASEIRHIIAGKELILFTQDGVYLATADGGSGFSYRTINLKKVSDTPAHPDVEPIQIAGKTIFVGEDGRSVYELAYNLMEDAIVPTDRSVLAYHLTETAQITKMAYQRFPDSVLWFLLDDGTLLAMTYMPEHEVWAWSHHSIAATDANLKVVDIFEIGSCVTDDNVETTSDVVLVLEANDESGDRDTTTVIERLRPNICANSLDEDDPAAECTDHVGGDSEVDVTATLVTLRPESPEVNTQGIPKNVKDVCLRLRRSGKITVVPYDSGLSTQESAGATVSGGTITFANGDIKLMPRGYINDDGQMQIASSDAKPCEILSAVYILDIPS